MNLNRIRNWGWENIEYKKYVGLYYLVGNDKKYL